MTGNMSGQNWGNKGTEIERIMAKIEQDNRILAELDHSRSTTLGKLEQMYVTETKKQNDRFNLEYGSQFCQYNRESSTFQPDIHSEVKRKTFSAFGIIK